MTLVLPHNLVISDWIVCLQLTDLTPQKRYYFFITFHSQPERNIAEENFQHVDILLIHWHCICSWFIEDLLFEDFYMVLFVWLLLFPQVFGFFVFLLDFLILFLNLFKSVLALEVDYFQLFILLVLLQQVLKFGWFLELISIDLE